MIQNFLKACFCRGTYRVKAVMTRIAVISRCRRGQAIVESLLAVIVLCIIFCGLFQVSLMFTAREIINHSSACGARAKTVGFNQWMVNKVVKVAAIPNAGKMTIPDMGGSDFSGEAQLAIEQARIPYFLASDTYYQSRNILDYENWDTIIVNSMNADYTMVDSSILQDYPLWVPLHDLFYNDDSIEIIGESSIENHCDLYINDMNW